MDSILDAVLLLVYGRPYEILERNLYPYQNSNYFAPKTAVPHSVFGDLSSQVRISKIFSH